MSPLFTGEFCPKNCDRPIVEVANTSDTSDTSDTDDIQMCFDWINDMNGVSRDCPDCFSVDIEPFPQCSSGDTHCVTCGHVWFR